MAVDLNALAQQFRGRKFAELILQHAKASSQDQAQSALIGLMDELPSEFSNPVMELIDFMAGMPQSEAKNLFGGDCGDKFIKLINVSRGFMEKQHGITLSDDEAFTVFNIIVQNYVHSCHSHPQTKAAMQKAAGIGLFGRMFRG